MKRSPGTQQYLSGLGIGRELAPPFRCFPYGDEIFNHQALGFTTQNAKVQKSIIDRLQCKVEESLVLNLTAGDGYGVDLKLTDLRGILQYVPQFREKTFIIAVDASIVRDESFANILLDIALLRSLNIRVVLIHGAAELIKALAERENVQASNLDGTGVTDAPTLELAIEAANRLTHEIVEGLSANDLRAAYTNAITTYPLGIIQGVDHLFTGKVERVDTELLQTLLNLSIVPVISPLGFNGEGKTFRANSDSVALAVAEALKATKLIFISHDGLRHNGQLIRQILVGDLQKLLQSERSGFELDMVSKARHAAAACAAGVQRYTLSTAVRTKDSSPKCSPTKASARLFTPTSTNRSGPPRRRIFEPSNG